VKERTMLKNIRYFSVAVTSINEGIKLYQDMFGLKQMTPVSDTRWGFKATMMGDGEKSLLEIIEPTDPNSPVARHMKERSRSQNPDGEGVYIIGVDVDDLDATIINIRDRGGRVTQDPELPDMAWVHPLTTKYAFIELHRQEEQSG